MGLSTARSKAEAGSGRYVAYEGCKPEVGRGTADTGRNMAKKKLNKLSQRLVVTWQARGRSS